MKYIQIFNSDQGGCPLPRSPQFRFDMSNRIDAFGEIIIASMVLISVFGFIGLYIDHSDELPGLLAMAGVWLIVSFFIMTMLIGSSQGIQRTKIQIPKKIAITVFTIASLLFFAAGSLSGRI